MGFRNRDRISQRHSESQLSLYVFFQLSEEPNKNLMNR